MHDLLLRQVAAARSSEGNLDLDQLLANVSTTYFAFGARDRDEPPPLEASLCEALAERAHFLEAEVASRTRELDAVTKTLEATLDNVEQGIMMIDGDHRVRVCNRRASELLELPASLMARQPLFADVLQYQWRINEFDITPEHIVEWIRSGGVADSPPIYERRRRNGTILEIRTILLRDGGAVRTYADITERRNQEDALREAERDYRSLFENAVVGIYRSTIDGRMLRANPALARLNGYEDESALVHAVGDFEREWYVDPARRAEFRRLMARDGRVSDFVSEVYAHATRKRIWVSETAWLVRDSDGAPAFYEGTVIDASDRIEAEARIARLAHFDELTGLPNRAFFKRRAMEETRRVSPKTPFAILCLDLDRFKNVNDTLGHSVGDQLLRAAANRLRLALGENDFVARLGGDEFAIIVRDFADVREVEARAAAIIEKLTSPFHIGRNGAVVGASIGIAFAPRDGSTLEELLQNADLALYRAKGEGRGAFRLYDNAMKEKVIDRRSIEMDLHGALANEEFTLFYQPLVRLSDRRTDGFEALIRWRHPSRGLVAPASFIPIAEETGLVAEIGGWVLRRACADLARLPEEMRISVNLSPAQLRGGDFVDRTANALAEFGIAPERLVLEITESVLMMDDIATLETLERLRAIGVRIALDDFGTGYSSLSYLQKFRVDEIKIDRSFVSRLESDPVASAVVRAVMALAADLGIRVVGEGVETLAQLNALEAFGCELAQGYLLGRPAPAEASFPCLSPDILARRVKHLRELAKAGAQGAEGRKTGS